MKYLDQIHTKRKVLKIITHSKYTTSNTVLFNKIEVLPVNILTTYIIGILKDKIYLKCIQEMFKTNGEFHKHETKNKHHLRS